MNRRIWTSTDTQKPCMCSFCALTTTKSYKMSPQMPLFIPITSKISANNNNLSCSILRRRRTCSISTSTSTLSLATTKIHRMSPQMPLSFLPFLKRGSIKSKDKNGSMNNWTIILDYSLTDKNMELKMWRKKNSSCARKQIESITTTSWWGSQCSKFSAPYSYLNGCKQEFSNILQKLPKIGQKCSLACGLAAGRPIRGVCPNCRLTLHSAANSAFMTCLTNYVIIWGANSPTTSTSTSTSGIWEANFNTNTIVSVTHLWYNW